MKMCDFDKIDRYGILVDTRSNGIVGQMGENWDLGWRPVGGICCANGKFYQAIVKISLNWLEMTETKQWVPEWKSDPYGQ